MNYQCRCKALKEWLGETAPPRCQVCEREAALSQFGKIEYTQIHSSHRLAYMDCAVEVVSVGHLGDRHLWAPSWAKAIVDVMYVPDTENARYCGPTLQRAATDETFRLAISSILGLVKDVKPIEAQKRLNAFAASQGIAPAPLAPA